MNLEKLVENVVEWADVRNLLKPENSNFQFLKVAEEFGEVAEGLAKGRKDLIADGIGDLIVTLIILAEQNGLTFKECLKMAYSEIANRKGKTINGVFIKESDLGVGNA